MKKRRRPLLSWRDSSASRPRSRRSRFECLEPRYVLDGSVVINEVMYHPAPVSGVEADYEYIELFNQMAINMDISGWRLEGAVSYTFPEGTTINGRGYKVIAANPSTLTSSGATNVMAGAFSGGLNNSGEKITLVNNSGRQMSVVDYEDDTPWPGGADGSGFSMAKQDQYSDSSTPASWRASRQFGGTPGTANFPSGADPGPAVVFNEIAAASAGAFWVEIANQGSTSVDLTGYQITNSQGSGVSYVFGSQSIGAGQVLLVDSSTLGFGANDGDSLFLFTASRDRLLDARKVTTEVRGLEASHGMDWLFPTVSTPGAANVFQLNSDVVINEIMYHATPMYPQAAVTNTVNLVPIDANQQWRYDQSTSLLSGWASVAHPVSATWLQGPGVLGIDPSPPAVLTTYPIRTTLANSALSRVTTYYETDFTFSGNLSDVSELSIGHIVDDGAVFYLNGVEVLRYNMPTGSFTSSTRPTSAIEASYVSAVIPKTALVVGTNRLSIEVHQAASTTDIVFGAELNMKTITTPAVPFTEVPEEWIELYNKGASAVDVSGWKFSDAMSYTIPQGTTIPAGGYLVVSNDAAALAAKYPSIASVIIGDFSGTLSNTSDNIALSDSAGNPVDNVKYYDSANWHENADGGGSSLELRSPDMDNSLAEAWAESLESSKSSWQTYTYTQVAAADVGPASQWNEFLFGFIESGSVLIDDVSVVVNPGTSPTELIQNGSFQSDTVGSAPLKWRIIGNHNGKVILDPTNGSNKVLQLNATGRTDHEGNNAGTTLAGNVAIVNGATYQITFKAKWLTGSPQLNSRLYLNRVTDTVAVAVPHNNGTPGAQNSTFVANAGPTYSDLKQGPVYPTAGQPVTISVRAADPNGIASMTLFYSIENASFNSVPMTLQASGFYTGTIPGTFSGAAVQFYVQGIDTLGASSTYPADGVNSRAMYEVNDGVGPTTAIDSVRIVAKSAEAANLLSVTNIMGNQNIRATIVYNNSEIFYDVGLRLKGSSASRGSSVWGGSYSIEFNPDHLFRGVYGEIALDSSGGPGGTGHTQEQVQMLVNQIANHAGAGLSSNYDDFAYVISPIAAHTGVDSLQLARYSSDYLDETYVNGSDGNLYEYELVYYSKTTVDGNPESLKNENGGGYVSTAPQDLGDDPDRYRWINILKNNRDEQDFTQMIAMMKAFSIADDTQFINTISNIIDVDQWLRTFAAATAMGVADTWATISNYHNINFYVRPTDGKIEMLPWDWDEPFFLGTTSTIYPGATGTALKRLLSFTNDHLYFHHLYDLATHELTTAYIGPWVSSLGAIGQQDSNFLATTTYLSQRRDSVLAQIESFVPSSTLFDITTNGGAPMSVTTPTVTLTGTGYVDFHDIRLRGQSQPLALTWSDYSHWQVTVPLTGAMNNVILDAYDVRGNLVHSDSISVTTSAVTATPVNSLRITEMNYHPGDPPVGSVVTDADDYEYIEFRNIGSTSINLAGCTFTNGITYTFPNITLGAGQYLLLAKNATAMLERYGITVPANQIYGGNLNNAGERLTLLDSGGLSIMDFTYLDDDWIPAADGPGYSMVVTNANAATSAWGTPAGWKRSANPDGSPGAADPLYIDGDYNRDGTVDAGDYTMYRKAVGGTGIVYTGADGNGNGVVDQGDLAVWRAHFGQTIFTSNGSGAGDGELGGGASLDSAAAPDGAPATEPAAAPVAAGATVGGASLAMGASSNGGAEVDVPAAPIAGDDASKPAALPPTGALVSDFGMTPSSVGSTSNGKATQVAGALSAPPADEALVAWLAEQHRVDRRSYSADDWLDTHADGNSQTDNDDTCDDVFAAFERPVFGLGL